jgi:TPP-dependent pyruvate/acetoin dehydrogenase alpha subunit
MYGMAQESADGNNVLDVYAATKIAADRARRGEGPTLLFAETFRIGGHATHDEAEARATFPAELFAYWGRRDPIGLYEEYLAGRGIARDRLEAIENDVIAQIDTAAERAAAGRSERMPAPEQVFANAGPRQPALAARLSKMQGA